MGVISVSGPQYGQLYNINIAGDAPTPDEQQRINQWVGQQEQLLSSQIQERFGAPAVQAEAPVVEEPDDEPSALGRGFRRGVENVQSLFGTALEEAGKGVGLKSLETYGRELEQESEEDLRKLDALARTTRRDVEGLGTGLSYVGEVAGEQAPILGATLSGAGTGAAIGSMFGPIGTSVGAVIGGAAASFPLLFGGNVQRQEEQVAAGELDKVDIEKALIAAGGQAAIEGIAGRILAFLPFKPGVGSLWARAGKGGAIGAGTEIPTEITQQLIERAQAGLPIDSDEAIQEYIDAGVAAGILGGGIGTVGGGFRKDQSKIELDQDLAETDPELAEAPPPGTLLLEAPEPQITVTEEQAVTPEAVALLERGIDPYEAEGFTINEYNAVLEQITNDGELLFPKAQAAIRERTGKKTAPTQLVRKIASVLEREGKISKSPRAKLDKYTLTPVNQRAQEAIDSLRRDTNNTLDAIRKITKTLPRLELDVRYAEQTGKDTSGKTVNAEDVRKKLASKQVLLNKLNERLQRNQEKLRSVNQDFNVPVSEKIGLPATQIRLQDFIEADRLRQQEELQRAQEAANARAAADAVRRSKDEKVEVRTENYTAEQGKVLDELKSRLRKMGLKDVRLEGQAAIRDDAGNIGYEGVSYTAPEGDQVIALSMGIYRPDLDQDAYVRRLGDVMNHEIIHAVRNLGLFTKKELELLSKAARKTKYVKTADGKTVKRNYTYFDRAQRINPELSVKKDKNGVLSSLEEEAIAEMFRDYSAGKLTKIGQSRSLLKRIADFFRSIVGAHVDNGFNSVDKIFGGLGEGTVGARQRVTAAPDVDTQVTGKPSRVPPQRMTGDVGVMPSDVDQAKFSRIARSSATSGLSNFIKNNPDGFTISPDTYEPVSGGYVVAPLKEAEIIVGDTLPEEVLLDYIQDNKDIARAVGRPVYLGGWFDSESNQYFLDNTLNVPTLDEALYIADAAEQLAVFDLNNFEEVRTDEGIRRLRESGAYSDNAAVGYKRRLEEIGRRFAEARNNRNAIQKEQLIGRERLEEPSLTDQEVEFPNYDNSVPVKTSRIYQPERTVKAYKMFTLGSDGQLYPLFVNADEAIPVGEWVGATFPLTFEVNGKKYVPSRGAVDDFGKPTKGTGDYKEVPDEATRQQLLDNGFKVSRPSKSAPHGKVLAVAARPGFHAGTLPKANHLGRTMPLTNEQAKIMRDAGYGASIKTREGKSYLKLRHPNHVWAEVLYPDNSHGTDWQSMADQTNTKDINDEMPIGGHYRYTQGAAGKDETWVISGDMLVNRILDPKEVDAIVGSNSKIPDNPRLDQVAEILGEQAAIDGQVALGQSRRYSRLRVPLTQEQRDASILDYLDPNTGQPLFNAKQGAETLVSFANKLLSLRNTRSYDIVNSEQDRDEVAKIFAAEAEAALLSSSDAIGWYDATLKLAKRVLSIKYPEISPVLYDGSVNPDYDPNAEVALDYATAVTSNGMAVTDNYDFAAEQYEALRGSQDGKFPVLGKGDQGNAMLGAFELWNALTDKGYTPTQINDLLMREVRRKDVDGIIAEALGVEVKDLPFRADTKEAANEIVSIAYLLGPKIGNGFYRNIRGNFDPITMDRWWMRFVNRITGNPIKNVDDELIEKNIDRVWNKIKSKDLEEIDKEILSLAVSRLNTKRLKRSDMKDLIPEIDKIFQRDYFAGSYNRRLKELVAEGYDQKDPRTREMAREARPAKTDFLRGVSRYVENTKQLLQEDPRTSSDRIAMRDVTARAKRILENDLGIEITNADLQALMWYAEKRIFAAGGVRKGRGEDNDYADGAIYVLKKRGVNDERIESALPAAERRRVRAVGDELKADIEADGATVTVDAPRRGDFFGPRRDVLESREGVVPENYNARYSRLPQYARVGQAGARGVGPADLAARAEMIRYTKVQDVMAKYLAKVPFISDKAAKEKTEAFMVKLQDSMLPVGKMYDTLREKYGPNVITQDMDAYFQESLMHGVAGPKKEKFDRTSFKPVLEQVANMNVTDQENSALGNVSGYYRDILKKHGNKSHALANAYLYALHAKERNARIAALSKGEIQNGSGMSNAEADSIISFVNALPPAKRATLRNIENQVQGMIKQTNEVYIDGGLIPDYMFDQDIDDGLKVQFERYTNYIPLRGFADPETDIDISEQSFSPAGQKFGSIGKPNRAALGRSSYAGDILANVAVQHHQAIDKAERNKVGQALLKLLESKDIDTSEFGVVLDQHPMKRAMVNGAIRYVPDRNFNSYEQQKDVEGAIENGPILAVRRGGKEYLLALDDKIAKAMKGSMSPKQMKAPINFLHNITRFYANLLTSYNPAFLLSNWPRDIETAIFNSQQYEMKGASKDIIKNVPKAANAIFKIARDKEGGSPYWRKRYQEFYENGGQNVLNQMSDQINASQDIAKTINNIVDADSRGLTQQVKKGFVGKGQSILGYIEALNTAVENSTRLAFFDRMASELKAQNVPEKEALKRAAFAARNLTTNFTKGGEMKNGLNTAYLFFNASMQGSMAIFNSLANSRKARQLAGSVVVLGFLMDQLNAAMSEEDEETGIKDYDSIGEYTRGHNFILPDLNGDGNYIKIPMAYGLNTLFNLGRITSNLIRGGMGDVGTYTPEKAGKELVGYVTEMINPFGGNDALSAVMPTAVDLPVELLRNKDFRDAPIYKELSPYQPYLSRSGLHWSTTSPSAIWISKFINDTLGGGDDYIPGEILGMRVDIQPDVIEHIYNFMTGGVGRLIGQSVDTATSNAPNAVMGQWESDMIRTTPFLNKFVTTVTDKDRSSDYYDKRDDVFAVRRSFRAALQNGDREQAINIRQKYPEIVRIMEPVNKIDRAITKLRKRLKMVKANKRIGDAQRKELIDKIEDRIYMLQSRGIQLMQGI